MITFPVINLLTDAYKVSNQNPRFWIADFILMRAPFKWKEKSTSRMSDFREQKTLLSKIETAKRGKKGAVLCEVSLNPVKVLY